MSVGRTTAAAVVVAQQFNPSVASQGWLESIGEGVGIAEEDEPITDDRGRDWSVPELATLFNKVMTPVRTEAIFVDSDAD